MSSKFKMEVRALPRPYSSIVDVFVYFTIAGASISLNSYTVKVYKGTDTNPLDQLKSSTVVAFMVDKDEDKPISVLLLDRDGTLVHDESFYHQKYLKQ